MACHSATILGCAGTTLSAIERAFFADAQPWAFILFARNIETAAQLSALTSDLRDAVGWHAPVLVDQEGGRVQRMRGPIWREWLPALDHVTRAGPAQAVRAMYLRYRLIAHELRAVGIDVNCAPLADVARPDTHPVLLNRLYGTDPDTVAAIAAQVAHAHLEGGVLPVVKHLPGYGLGRVDSHHELPRVTVDRTTLEAVDFAAFRPLKDHVLGMTAHIIFEAFGHARPATMDAAMIDLIRTKIGFQGALMTDDLSMNALPGSIGDRAQAARAAGVDLVLHCNGDMAEMTAVVDRSGTLDGAARDRANAALAARKDPDPLDIAATEADLADLLGGEVYV